MAENASPSVATDNLIIRKIEPGDNVSGLSLGSEEFAPLKAFLRNHAQHYHDNNVGKTYVVVEHGKTKVMGYMTVLCNKIELENGHQFDAVENYPYDNFPAVKVARLAVHQSLKGKKVGRSLIDLAVGIARDTVMPVVGCRFLVVDAKKTAVGFYEKCGFTLLKSKGNQEDDKPLLFIDLQKI